MEGSPINSPDRDAALRILRSLADDPTLAEDDLELRGLITKIAKRARKENRRRSLEEARTTDRLKREQTLRCQADPAPQSTSPSPQLQEESSSQTKLNRPANCYICKDGYTELHHRYHLLCPKCAAENEAQRERRSDLCGRIALITGGRIKIGKEIVLRLLRDGATVHLTTRFPGDSLACYEQTQDYGSWQDRLHIHAIDLRNIPRVEEFTTLLDRVLPHLDILINNAAQTIRRPLAYYRELLAAEPNAPVLLEALTQIALPLPAGAMASFPEGKRTAEGQPLDLRESNSWRTRLDELDTPELLEVQLVNSIAPCLLVSRLKPALLRSPNRNRFVVNVSAVEGQFDRPNKTVFHPHTNMAKASLNMLTRTSAQDYAEDRIYMTSVDTGWITQENPFEFSQRQREAGFVPPLDIVDGAARVLAPIRDGVRDDAQPQFGMFLKDYRPTAW